MSAFSGLTFGPTDATMAEPKVRPEIIIASQPHISFQIFFLQ